MIWRCNSKFKGEKKCGAPHLDTETIQQKFLLAYNQLMGNRAGVIADCTQIRRKVSDCAALDAEIEKLTEEINIVAEMVKACVKENASSAQSQAEYSKKYNSLVKRYEKTAFRLDSLSAERVRKQDRDRELRLFIEALKQQPPRPRRLERKAVGKISRKNHRFSRWQNVISIQEWHRD